MSRPWRPPPPVLTLFGRASSSYIANRVTDKLTKVVLFFLLTPPRFRLPSVAPQITDYIYCCRSGSAAHTQAVADIVAFQAEFLAAQLGEEPEVRRPFFRGRPLAAHPPPTTHRSSKWHTRSATCATTIVTA